MNININKQIIAMTVASLIVITGCSSSNSDKSLLESYNRGMYKTNRTIDKYTLKPITKGYQAITPDPVEKGVTNFFKNIAEINTFANSLLQGKLKNAGLSSSRFVWNTTLGVAGIFDVATGMGIQANKEDLGQTFRYWGVPTGPYVVLPLWGPSTITDGIGLVGDYYMSPLSKLDWEKNKPLLGVTAIQLLDTRSKYIELEKMLETATTDEYTFVKNAFLQRRESLTRDGEADQSVEDEFDALFDDEEE